MSDDEFDVTIRVYKDEYPGKGLQFDKLWFQEAPSGCPDWELLIGQQQYGGKPIEGIKFRMVCDNCGEGLSMQNITYVVDNGFLRLKVRVLPCKPACAVEYT